MYSNANTEMKQVCALHDVLLKQFVHETFENFADFAELLCQEKK